MIWLFLAFTVIPAVELALLLALGSAIGPLYTFLLVVLTGVVGASLAKREGWGVLLQLREELGQGLPSGARLMEGALVVVGGLLLVTPGVLTDLVGVALLFPYTRRWLAPRLLAALLARVQLSGTFVQVGRPRAPDPFTSPFDR